MITMAIHINPRFFSDNNNQKTKIPSSTNNPGFFADGIEKQLYYGTENRTVTRREALQEAATNFLNSVAADATASNVDHRIAVVGFSSSSETKNTLTAVNTDKGKNTVQNSINRLKNEGATQTNYGMNSAKTIFDEQSSYKDAYNNGARKKVVVLFTDGVPTGYRAFDSEVANSAIGYAKNMKDNKTTIYTIGIFEGADASANIKYNQNAAESSTEEKENANTFMQFVSSNFPNAGKMDKGGTGNISGGYYLTAKNTTDLNKIFDSISESIGESTIPLDGTTQTIDKMSTDFKLPAGTTASEILVYKVPYTGKDENNNDTFETDEAKWKQVIEGITVDTANDTVTVTRFDYTKDYVVVKDGKPQGYKLVVRIPAEYKNEAWFGGNNIESNDIGSGIYNGGSCYGTFDTPKVNRAIDYKIAAKDQTIYVTNKADLQGLLDYFETTDKKYEPNGTNNKYVDITYTLKDATGKEVGTFTIKAGQIAAQGTWESADGQTRNPELEDCTTYTWTCTVKPNQSDGNSLGVAGTGNVPAEETKFDGKKAKQGTVHVLYPTVNAKDEFIYWGETKDPDTLITVADDWTDRDNTPNTLNLIGKKPKITTKAVFQTGEEGNTPSKDSDYNVEVKIAGADKTDLIRQKGRIETGRKEHQSCDDTTGVTGTTTAKDFRIHVKVKKLTVEKIVGGNMGDTNKNFTFTGGKIYTNDAKKTEVTKGFTLKHGQKETFKLKVGDDVSITEESVAGYETSYKVGDSTVVKGNKYDYNKVETGSSDEVTVTYTNTKTINPPNGIITTIAPYAIMVVLAAGAAVYFVYSRRRHNG